MYATGSGGGCEEYWYLTVPDAAPYSCKATDGPYREVQIKVDGQLAGIAAPFPTVWTGGWSNPFLWYVIPGPRAFDIKPDRIRSDPLRRPSQRRHARTSGGLRRRRPGGAGRLEHSRQRAGLAGRRARRVTGGLTAHERANWSTPRRTRPVPVDEQHRLDTDGAHRLTVAGYVDTSHGRVATTVSRALANTSVHRWTDGENTDGLTATWTDAENVTVDGRGPARTTRTWRTYTMDGTTTLGAGDRLRTVLTLGDREAVTETSAGRRHGVVAARRRVRRRRDVHGQRAARPAPRRRDDERALPALRLGRMPRPFARDRAGVCSHGTEIAADRAVEAVDDLHGRYTQVADGTNSSSIVGADAEALFRIPETPGGVLVPQSVPSPPRRGARILRTSLFAQVAVALVLGIVVGKLWPDVATDLKPLGDGFTRLIKTIISPLVFCVVVVGIAKAGDLKAFGRIGLKALIWFEVASTLALVIGLLAANIVQPGSGMNVDPSTLDTSAIDAKTGGGSLPVDDRVHRQRDSHQFHRRLRRERTPPGADPGLPGGRRAAPPRPHQGAEGAARHRAGPGDHLRGRRLHHAARPDRRVRRDGRPDRPVRTRRDRDVRQADHPVLRGRRALRRAARRRSQDGHRAQPLEVPPLHP